MNKLLQKVAKIFLGLSMAAGIGVAVESNSKEASPVHAADKIITLAPRSVTSVADKTDDNGKTWTMASDAAGWTSNASYIHAGSGSKKVSYIRFTTSAYSSETIKSISLFGAAKASTSATLKIYVGGTLKAESAVLGNTASSGGTELKWTNTDSSSGEIKVEVSRSTASAAALYFNQAVVNLDQPVKVTSVSLNKNSTTITAGGSETLTATVLPNDATNKTLTWSVSPSGQGVTVSNGTVSTTAQATPGQYTVTATATDGSGKSGSCTVTVASAAAETITVTSSSSSLYVGDSDITLTATPSNFSPATYTWSSSDTSVATISGTGTTGTLHALTKGTTNITASATGSNGLVVSNSFTVTVKVFSISLSPSSIEMKASKSTTVTVTPTDATGTVVVTAVSANNSIASTSVSGTTITITSGSEGGVSTTITVSAIDNNGASGYHTAANKTISVEVTAGYVIGNKITDLPSSDKYVFLGTGSKNYWVGTPNGSNQFPQESSDENAALYILSSTGTLRYYNQDTDQAGNYIYCTGSATTVSYSSSTAQWSAGMDNASYRGLLQLSGNRFLMFNSNIVKAYAGTDSNLSNNASLIIYAYEATASTPTAALSGDSVSGMKGDSNTSLTLTISNFTATGLNVTYKDDGESSFSASSDVATVTCGHSTGSNTVSVSFVGVGSTTVKLSVTRGSGDPIEKTFTVTVAAKPNLLRVVQNRAANPLVDITSIELQNGGSARQFAKTNIYVEDTDENPIEIGTISEYVTLSRISGDDCISISGGEITGTSVGTAVVKFELKSLTSVYDTVTVSVIDDYKTTVNTISVINGAEVSQGETLKVSNHISTKTANTHFGSTMAIADNELLFSYTNSRSAGVISSSFVFDVEDNTLDAGETETRTIYVFASFDENYAGTSFTAVIEVADRPVTGLIVDDVEKSNNDTVALSLPRNSSYDFNSHVTVNPANATESHDIIYTLTSGGSYVSLSNGVITIGSKIGSSVATITAKPYAKQDFSITFTISITREAMTIVADLPESWSKASSIAVGDIVAIVCEGESANHQLSGVTSNIGQYEDYDNAGEPSSSYLYTVGAGNAEDTFTFSSGSSYLAYTSTATSKQNNLYTVTSPSTNDELNQVSWSVSFENGDADIVNVYNTGRHLQWNDGSPRFCCYNNGGQTAVQIYKLSGGTAEVTVTDALFNIINNAMSLKDGSSTLYDLGLCNASGTSFDVSTWNTLGSSFTSSIISDNKLAYARADENGNEIEQFLAVYDYVIGKKESGYAAYASANDFLGRVASGKITASPRVSPLVNIIGENTNTVAIIVIISMVSVTAIGGYFFYRKRKEI